jgi:hypothetical protein
MKVERIARWRPTDSRQRCIKWPEYGPCPEPGCGAKSREPCRNLRVHPWDFRPVTRPHASRWNLRRPGGVWPHNPDPVEAARAAVVVRGHLGLISLERMKAAGWRVVRCEDRPLGQHVYYLDPPERKVAS